MNTSNLPSTTWQCDNVGETAKIECQDSYGDKISKSKSKKVLRVVFQNINGLRTTEETDKRQAIHEYINTYKIDVFALAEVNINWKIVEKKKSLSSLAKEWFEHGRAVTSHNMLHNTKAPHQQGGVAIITSGNTALQVAKSEQDPQYLGRWCSVKVRGKGGVIMRIVSVYVPIVTKSHGNKTVHAQQQAALLKLKKTKSVIATFWSDLWKEIDKWIENGEKLVITGDWNQDVQSQSLVKAFEGRNLFPVVTGGRHRGVSPETYNNGSYPIDECFALSDLLI